jgi:hypothetical protein
VHLFAPFQRWSTIAVAAPPVSIFPDDARRAKQAARRELGAVEFDAWSARVLGDTLVEDVGASRRQ